MSGKHYFSNKVTGATQWVTPKIQRWKAKGVPKWLRAESAGVADAHIIKVTTGAELPRNDDHGRGGGRSPKQHKTGKYANRVPASGQVGPQTTLHAASTDANDSTARAGTVCAGLNWYGVFQKHGRMTIGTSK